MEISGKVFGICLFIIVFKLYLINYKNMGRLLNFVPGEKRLRI